jgi:hypothetical protein
LGGTCDLIANFRFREAMLAAMARPFISYNIIWRVIIAVVRCKCESHLQMIFGFKMIRERSCCGLQCDFCFVGMRIWFFPLLMEANYIYSKENYKIYAN